MTTIDDRPTWMRRSRGMSFASLGFLEADILTTVWALEQATVREVYEILHARRQIAYTTVMTVMTTLVGKGLLARDGTKMAFVYMPAIPREEVIAAVLDSVVECLCNGETATAVSHLLGLPASLSREQVEQLREVAHRSRKAEMSRSA